MMEFINYPPELLQRKHVAYLLSTSDWGVGELVRQKKLTPVDDGGKWQKFRLDDVKAYVQSLPEVH